MNRAAARQHGKGTLDVLEEAVHLLRTAPLATLASYYLGALPFGLGLLYFWTDMSRSADAGDHLAGATLGMAGLFVWLKFWQTVFAHQLRAQMAGQAAPPFSLRRCGRMVLAQTALQPTGLFLLPLSTIPVLPFGWLYAFYQNLTALGGGEAIQLRDLVKKARRQASLWPLQNHFLLAILSGFGLCVFLNWATVCFILPGLVKMFFGVESIFTRSGLSMLNTTFFAAMFCLTYLSVDPLVKAVYALRCFYGEAQHSGEDLRAELRHCGFSLQPVALWVLVALLAAGACHAREAGDEGDANAPPVGEASATLSAPELDRAIQKVIQQSKYSWRAPREKKTEEAREKGLIARFLERVWELLSGALKTVCHWLWSCVEWFFKWLGKILARLFRPPSRSTPGYGWVMSLHLMLYVLVIGVVAGLVFLIYRAWQHRRQRAETIASEPMQPVPDLTDENVGADQLPEDGWTKLARELLTRGELRLALRAFYLASLAHLAERNLISLAKFKSNYDYQRELHRRGHSFPELLATFGENVLVFDRVWYGLHEINEQVVGQFAANVERMKAGGMT